jgi:glycine cleavage system aminomethyltransferase T
VTTGAFDGPRDAFWFRRHLPDDGSVTFTDLTSAYATIGLWGPRARDVMSGLTDADVSNDAFPYGTTQEVLLGSIPARLLRISYVGELGWEIYVQTDYAPAAWDRIAGSGAELDIRPAGGGVYGTTGRLEKGYRLMGAELDGEHTVVEAGLGRPKVKELDFVGKAAYLAHREQEPAAVLCTLTVEDHRSPKDGIARYMVGGEAITTERGERIVDTKGRPAVVTTAGAGPSVGRFLLMAYLPAHLAEEGRDLCVYYMDELYPVRVAVAGSTPLFDPTDSRKKA